MIEKFTKEELDQIRIELAAMDKTAAKDVLCNVYGRIREIETRKTWERKDKLNIEKLRTAVYLIVDQTLGNVKTIKVRREYRNGRRSGDAIRNTNAVLVDPKEYAQMCNEIIQVIEAHFKYEDMIEKHHMEVVGA